MKSHRGLSTCNMQVVYFHSGDTLSSDKCWVSLKYRSSGQDKNLGCDSKALILQGLVTCQTFIFMKRSLKSRVTNSALK